MKKLSLLASAGAALALLVPGAGSALASDCGNVGPDYASSGPGLHHQDGTTTNIDALNPNPVDGGYAYAGGDGDTGYAGITGPHGWIEADGSLSSGTGSLQGQNADNEQLGGNLTLSTDPSNNRVCVGHNW